MGVDEPGGHEPTPGVHPDERRLLQPGGTDRAAHLVAAPDRKHTAVMDGDRSAAGAVASGVGGKPEDGRVVLGGATPDAAGERRDLRRAVDEQAARVGRQGLSAAEA